MIRTLTILLLAGVLISTGCTHGTSVSASAPGASDQTAANTADDQQKLQGTWKMDGATFNGMPMMNDIRWVFEGDHLTIVAHGNYEGGVKAPYQLGTGDSPNTILIKYFDNPLAAQGYSGGSYTGIYKLSGDKLRVCYDMGGRKYPKSFDAPKGSGFITYEFTREKA